jgi:hypothetical protein
MASHYYGVNMGAGQDASNVSTGTSTTSKNVELVVVDGVSNNNKKQVILAVKAILAKLIKSDDVTG